MDADEFRRLVEDVWAAEAVWQQSDPEHQESAILALCAGGEAAR